MMGEEVFQLHVATPAYATHPMSLYKARHKTISTGSSFPAGVQKGHIVLLVPKKGLLSLLVLYRFPYLKVCHGNQTK